MDSLLLLDAEDDDDDDDDEDEGRDDAGREYECGDGESAEAAALARKQRHALKQALASNASSSQISLPRVLNATATVSEQA